MKEEILKWTKQAEHDFLMAKSIIDDGGYDTCAFLCQQAVEKYLKAFYIFVNKKPPPKIHYLDELGEILKVPQNIIEKLKDLSADYMISRYPDVATLAPYEEYSKEDANGKVDAAKEVIDWVNSKIKDEEIKKYLDLNLKKIQSYYDPQEMWFFGSRAAGNAKQGSDIDMIMVSKKFKGIKFIHRMGHYLKNIPYDRHVDAVCYTPEEFSKKKNEIGIISGAIEHGIKAI